MATDIVLDDKTGDCISLNSAEVATSGFLTIDNPVSRGTPAGDRVALRHDDKDGLSVNPGRGYPDGVSIECANLNMKVNDQKGTAPKLPRRAEVGDVLFIRNSFAAPVAADERPFNVENCTLWVCVGRAGGAATWAQVALSAPVTGTI